MAQNPDPVSKVHSPVLGVPAGQEGPCARVGDVRGQWQGNVTASGAL